MIKRITDFILDIGQGLRSLYNLCVIRCVFEKKLFVFSLIYYYTLYLLFIFNMNEDMVLTVMGYDTRLNIDFYSLNHIFTWNLRHPLFAIMSCPLSLIRFCFNSFHQNIAVAVMASVTPFVYAMSNLLISKVLTFLRVRKEIIVLSVLMFSSCAHTMLLSSQYETYPYSLFLLLLLLLYVLSGKGNNIQDNILVAFITGVTSTNILKVFAFFFVSHHHFIGFVKRCALSVFLLLVMLVVPVIAMFYGYYLTNDFYSVFWGTTLWFTDGEVDIISSLKDNFLCEPLFFHNFKSIFYDSSLCTSTGRVLRSGEMHEYVHFLIPTFITIIYTYVCLGVYRFYKTPIVKFFLLNITIDLFIFLVLKFGIDEGQLYCMHWMFFVPIILGVFLNSMTSSLLYKISVMILSTVIVGMFVYNYFAILNELMFKCLV